MTSWEVDAISLFEWEEYEMVMAAEERVKEIEGIRVTHNWGFDEVEAHCIAVLDSEFMNYPDGVLEQLLMDYLDDACLAIQEENV